MNYISKQRVSCVTDKQSTIVWKGGGREFRVFEKRERRARGGKELPITPFPLTQKILSPSLSNGCHKKSILFSKLTFTMCIGHGHHILFSKP